MEKALKQILSNNLNIFGVVGNNISPIKRDSFPSITYQKVNLERNIDLSGKPIGPHISTFTVTARAESYKTAKDLAVDIASALSDLSGVHYGQKIDLSTLNDESENQLLDPDIVEISLDFTFYHTATN